MLPVKHPGGDCQDFILSSSCIESFGSVGAVCWDDLSTNDKCQHQWFCIDIGFGQFLVLIIACCSWSARMSYECNPCISWFGRQPSCAILAKGGGESGLRSVKKTFQRRRSRGRSQEQEVWVWYLTHSLTQEWLAWKVPQGLGLVYGTPNTKHPELALALAPHLLTLPCVFFFLP